MDIEAIQQRNARVEADKAWETSWTRKLIIAAGTYIIVGFYLTFLEVERAFLHALVPAGAYLISTFSLPFFKRWWIKNIYRANEVSS